MRSLDELIQIVETSKPDADNQFYEIFEDDMEEILFYLKEYKRSEDYVDEILVEEENFPLTWNDLKEMEGKPVWIEYDNNGIEFFSNPHMWAIVGIVDEKAPLPEVSFVGRAKTFWLYKMEIGEHWNAYRRENNGLY